ncbi:MAG TPA: arylsulfatase, partial [Verrucomicrobiales bacterium]|nr:arylsulfatase [Verrucomicrobiales bacterium]
ALLNGAWKLIRPSHRPVQLFQPGIDASESSDQLIQRPEQAQKLLNQLAHWESMLPTAPLWSSSPYWQGQSASHYDHYKPREEPR